jgi:Putative auto-transporter adhesin, head GIN domain
MLLTSKRPALILAFTLLATSTASHAAEKTFLIGSFDELLVEGDIRVVLDNMKAPSAKAKGDRDAIEAVKIDRNGLTVRVRIQDYEGDARRKIATEPLVITLGGRGVTKVSVNGSANLSINQMRNPGGTASIKVSGPGSVSIGAIDADRLAVNLAGTGSVKIDSGQVRSGQFGIDGTGSMTAPLLTMKQAKLSQSGNATSHLQVEEQVEISNSGSGTIKVDGKATCFIRQPGSAKILCGKTPQP